MIITPMRQHSSWLSSLSRSVLRLPFPWSYCLEKLDWRLSHWRRSQGHGWRSWIWRWSWWKWRDVYASWQGRGILPPSLSLSLYNGCMKTILIYMPISLLIICPDLIPTRKLLVLVMLVLCPQIFLWSQRLAMVVRYSIHPQENGNNNRMADVWMVLS